MYIQIFLNYKNKIKMNPNDSYPNIDKYDKEFIQLLKST